MISSISFISPTKQRLFFSTANINATLSEASRLQYLIRLHWRVLDHHALHLVAHIALLVASESEVGCWLHAHYGLVAGRWVWHHGLVH